MDKREVADFLRENGHDDAADCLLYEFPEAPAERKFPMMDGPPIPWQLAEVIYSGYSALYGTDQSLDRIAERGGFGWGEIVLWWNTPHPRGKQFREALAAAQEGGQTVSTHDEIAREVGMWLRRACTVADIAYITKALDAAHAAGRKEGVEEAALWRGGFMTFYRALTLEEDGAYHASLPADQYEQLRALLEGGDDDERK